MVRHIPFVLAVLAAFSLADGLQSRGDDYPPGTYKDTSKPVPFGGGCIPIEYTGGRLVAECVDFFGFKQLTSLEEAAKCVDEKGDIKNVNGTLRCVISFQEVKAAHPYTANIISISSDVKSTTYPCLLPPCKPNQETEVFRIDQPRVDTPLIVLKDIVFQPGDTIELTAGGCVQPGGHGLTWKLYADPRGGASDQYYSGLAFIAGTTGEAPQRIGAIARKTFTVPIAANPALRKDVSLQLGYQDTPTGYADAGYWGHDNGESDQCLSVGPAWVEVTVNRQSFLADAPKWSPHSNDPFDLVWDLNNEDFNGLPLNPQWAYQLDTAAGLIDFQTACGTSFTGSINTPFGPSGGVGINRETLAHKCTSQPVYLDLFTGEHWCWGSCLCDGLINGHLNWTVATYVGWIGWQEYSGNWPDDGDYNLEMSTTSLSPMTPATAPQAGFTALNWSQSGDYGIGLEFKGGETVDNAGGPWWQALDQAKTAELVQKITGSAGPTLPQQMFDQVFGIGLEGVVTGLFGVDGVHGGYSELHPVFAIALRTEVDQVNDGSEEKWVFFLRNFGNEGECSSNTHVWPNVLNNEYFIQVPWWPGATDVKVVGPAQAWPWQDGETKVSILRSPELGWMLVKVRFPNDGQNGVDGQFVLHYTVPATRNAVQASHPKQAGPPRHKKEKEDQVLDISPRIADPGVRAKFKSDFDSLKSPSGKPRTRRAPITIDTSLQLEPRKPEATSRGQLTPTTTTLDPAKKQLNDAMKKLLDTYSSHMQPPPK